MIAAYNNCKITFSVNSKEKGYPDEWVKDITEHTLTDKVVCIEEINREDSCTTKDLINALVDFCASNADTVILTMFSSQYRDKTDESGAPAYAKKERNQMYKELAMQRAIYEVLGFMDVSSWIDYDGTCVFLYKNDNSIDFVNRLLAYQSGSFLSSITVGSIEAAIIESELRDSPDAVNVLHEILDKVKSEAQTQKMNAF